MEDNFTEESETLAEEKNEEDTQASEEAVQEEESSPETESEKEEKEIAREKSKVGIIESYAKKIESGEVMTKDVPLWVLSEIEKRASEKEMETEEERFLKQREKLNKENFSEEEKEIIEKEFDELVSYGMPKDVALVRAVAFAGIEAKGAVERAHNEGIALGRMSLPSAGQNPSESKTAEIEKLVKGAIETESPSELNKLEGKDFDMAWERYGKLIKKR